MADQAATLRRLMQQRGSPEKSRGASSGSRTRLPKSTTQVITVASGKGGVGKTCLVANLGAMLARSGAKVLLVDGDFGLANLDIVLGVQSLVTLEQVLDGSASLNEAIVGVEPNLWLIPSSSGLLEMRTSTLDVRQKLVKLFAQFPWEMDYIILDSGAGIQQNVLSLHSPQFRSVVVVTPEPTSIMDAYSLIKTLRRKAGIDKVGVVVNQVTGGREGQFTFQKLRDVAARFVDVQLEYLGHWQRDEKITQAVMKRKILLDLYPEAASVPSLELLAKRLGSNSIGAETVLSPSLSRVAEGGTTVLWRTLFGEVNA